MPIALTRWLRFSSLTVYRLVTWSLLAAAFAVGAVILGLRYWVLPNVDQHRETIARMIGQGIGQRIAIGRVSGNWDGLHPELVMEGITIFDREGRPALQLARIEGVLSWFSFAAVEPRFRSVEISDPVLSVRRDARGALYVAGIELKEGESDGFVDWLLRQRKLSVVRAAITWHDELRGAGPLEFTTVDLLVRNRGNRHRFGIRATPPSALAGRLDLRGELYGKSTSTLASWNGQLYLQVDSIAVELWRPWMPELLAQAKGSGAVRMWAALRARRLTALTADVRLAGVQVRLARDLPELTMTRLTGRIGWKDIAGGIEIATTGLALETGKGLAIEPTDFLLRYSAGDGAAARGELRANAIALEPLSALAAHLPFEDRVREQLAAFAPRGKILDLAWRWNGDWWSPSQYVARGRFQTLGVAPVGNYPGFAGLSGTFEGNERSGTMQLESTDATFDLPRVFRGPLDFDTLTAEIGWAHVADATELSLRRIAFGNDHMAGSASGSYRFTPDSRGAIDVTGTLTRADARYVAHYVPLVIGQSTRDWLDRALVSGQSNAVTLRLKGDLGAFPFPENQGGLFEVVAKVSGGALDYAEGWPRIDNIAGQVVFRGRRVEVTAQGSILGAKLGMVRAEIPDVVHDYEVLHIAGEADGSSAEFLAFIEKSPVLDMIDRFTLGMQLQGAGKLALKLELPLRAIEKSRVVGVYQFAGNRLVLGPDLPPLDQASGRLEFTEANVRLPGATATFLGGPIVLSSAPQNDATLRINAQGRSTIDSLRQYAGDLWWLRHVSGAADWKGVLVLRKKLADLTVESDLRGVTSDLPDPLRKSAAQEVPLRMERRFIGPLNDRVNFAYGDIVSASFVRQHGNGKDEDVVRRGTIHFGGAALEPDRDGLWVSGTLRRLDLDQWLALAADRAHGAQMDVAGLELRFHELSAIRRSFHEVAVKAEKHEGEWRAALSGREFDGTVAWESQGRGKLTARMKRLVIPDTATAERRDEKPGRGRDLPGLDLVAQQFGYKEKALGKLELMATPVERNWSIDRLQISNPDGVLVMDGLVHDMASQPRTRAKVRLDVTDVGKFLTRLGYPEGVRRGTAHLEGTLAWPGGPHDFELSVLAGNLRLDATKGQFVRLEPGIGKLLGIVSLQALPRRVTLDFRDIFSEGFAFDQIAGELAIERGIMKTDNFRIQGPAARIAMSGEVDLAKESQRLRVRIVPSLSDSVSIAGALIGGPVAGVATILAQKILKDPLDQIFAYEYNVTGTWTEPQVSKIDRPSPAATETN